MMRQIIVAAVGLRTAQSLRGDTDQELTKPLPPEAPSSDPPRDAAAPGTAEHILILSTI